MANKNYEHKLQIEEEEEDGEVEINLDPNWKPPKEDEPEVEVAEEKEPVAEPEAEEEEEAPPPVKLPDPELARLREELQQIRAEQAERDRLAAEGYSAYEEQQIDNKLAEARAKFKAAQEAGDSEAALAAMDEITDLKVSKEARKYVPKPETQKPQRPQAEPAQNPLTARWLAANPWYGQKQNAAETVAVRVIDADMVAEGWQPNTEDYFEEMNRRLAKKFKSVELGSISKKKPPLPKTAPPSGVRTVQRKGTVTLGQRDFQTMRMVGLDPNNAADRRAYALEKRNYQDEA